MLNTSARHEAIHITGGDPYTDETNDKVVMYGILGRSFNLEDLNTLFHEQPEPTSLLELRKQLGTSLKGIAVDNYYSLLEDEQKIVERLFARKYPQANFDIFGRNYADTPFPLERMVMGAISAAEREVQTLRTIAKLANEDAGVTQEGLSASVRVPLKLSLFHLFDLETEIQQREFWREEDGGDNGAVLPSEAIDYDPQKGLYLHTPPQYPDEALKQKYGPQIGCPAGFVSGYIQAIHNTTVQRAVETRLIKLDK